MTNIKWLMANEISRKTFAPRFCAALLRRWLLDNL
jgi:hypothetical protein